MTASVGPGGQHRRIVPPRGRPPLQLGDMWRGRELLYFLTWRDVKVRYKQTLLGVAWAVLQPFLMMVVLTVFKKMGNVGSNGLPDTIFTYSNLLLFNFASQGVNLASLSLVSSASLIRKISFPRMVLPISAVLGGFVDFAFAFVVLVGMMAYYQIWPGPDALWLPLYMGIGFVTAIGLGSWLAALYVKFRDVRYLVPFFLQIWLFASPVIYPAGRMEGWIGRRVIPRSVHAWFAAHGVHGVSGILLGLNPMSGAVEGFRRCLLGGAMKAGAGTVAPLTPLVVTSSVVALLIFLSGMRYFRRVERSFADVI